MENNIIFILLSMIVLIMLSAYFSATETAFSSLNKTRVKTLAEKGSRKASLVLSLSEDYDRLLSTILIGNNIVNIALASIGTVLFVHLWGDIGATISTLVVTIVVLIFGEVTPKSMAKEHPERFAMSVSGSIRVLIVVLTPINFLFSLWKKLIGKIFHHRDDRRMTQDELLMLVEEVEQDGSIDADEGDLLRSAIEFTDRDAEDILTHRVDLEGISIDASHEEIAATFSESRYSRLLVYEESIDNIVGVLHQKDFYVGNGITSRPITEIMTTPLFVPQSIKISDILKELQKAKSHVAVVSDEYGGTLGIVTMEDILEELVGEIYDEHDEVIELFKVIDETTDRVSCSVDLNDFEEHYDIVCDSEAASVGGWVMEQLERIPAIGDSFPYGSLVVTVTETDARRVMEIEVKRIPQEEDQEQS